MRQGTGGWAVIQRWSRAIRNGSWVVGVWVPLAALVAPAGLAGQALDLPAPVGFVNDFAGVIDGEQERMIDGIIQEVRAKSGGEIVVVTLPSLQGRSIDEVALQIGREWRIGAAGEAGDAGRNNGLVVLVAPTERRYKIELGLGTNTFITAAEAGAIGRDYMVPAFQQNDYGLGIARAVTALAGEYAERFDFELTGQVPEMARERPRGTSPDSGFTDLLILAIVIFLVIAAWRGRGGGGGGGRGGGGGGVAGAIAVVR